VKKTAELTRHFGDPIVVPWDINMYRRPGQSFSILEDPGWINMHGIVSSRPADCPWNVCPVLAYASAKGINWTLQKCDWQCNSMGGIGTHLGLSGIHGGPQ